MTKEVLDTSANLVLPPIDPVRATWGLLSNNELFPSPLSLKPKVVSRTGWLWKATLIYENLALQDREMLQRFLAECDGMANPFWAYDHSYPTVPGSPTFDSILTKGERNFFGIDDWQVGVNASAAHISVDGGRLRVDVKANNNFAVGTGRAITGLKANQPHKYEVVVSPGNGQLRFSPSIGGGTSWSSNNVYSPTAVTTPGYFRGAFIPNTTAVGFNIRFPTTQTVGNHCFIDYINIAPYATVNPTSQSGSGLDVKMVRNSVEHRQAVRAGFPMGLNGRVHKLTSMLLPDTSDNAHVNFKPPIVPSMSPGSGDMIGFHQPLVKCRLASAEVGWETNNVGYDQATITIIEDPY